MKANDLMAAYLDANPPGEENTLDAGTQQRTLEKALVKAGLTKSPRRPRTKQLITLLVAAILIITCTTAVASDQFQLNDAFAELFDLPSQTQLNQLERSGSYIGQSVVADDITITMEGAVGDRQSSYVFFTVQLPESYTIPAPAKDETMTWFWFENFQLWVENGNSQGYYTKILSQEENILRFFLALNNDQPLSSQKIDLTLSDLKVAKEEGDEIVAAGPWHFSFPLEYTDNSIKIPLSGTVKPVENSDLRITDLWISPLSISLECSRPISCLWKQEERSTDDLLSLDITFHMKDGSVLGLEGDILDSSCNSRGLSVQLNRGYRTLIDIEELTGIQIGTVWIPIK